MMLLPPGPPPPEPAVFPCPDPPEIAADRVRDAAGPAVRGLVRDDRVALTDRISLSGSRMRFEGRVGPDSGNGGSRVVGRFRPAGHAAFAMRLLLPLLPLAALLPGPALLAGGLLTGDREMRTGGLVGLVLFPPAAGVLWAFAAGVGTLMRHLAAREVAALRAVLDDATGA